MLPGFSAGRSGAGRVGQIWIRQDAGPNWREIEPLLALHLLVLAATENGSATHRQVDVELIERIFLSCQATKRYLNFQGIKLWAAHARNMQL